MSYQQFHEDVERLKDSGMAVGADYFWWPDETDDPFKELLKEKKQHEGSQIRTYPAMKADGTLTLWMCLFDTDGKYITGFDASHGCPPFC